MTMKNSFIKKVISRYLCLMLAVFALAATSARAHWQSLSCKDAGGTLPAGYLEKLCKADDLARLGKYDLSEYAYRSLLEMPIYESPNFEALVDLARVQCMAGKIESGILTLVEFNLALQIFDGTKKCTNLKSQKGRIERNTYRRMCSELLSDTYKSPTLKESISFVSDLRQRYVATSTFCTARKIDRATQHEINK